MQRLVLLGIQARSGSTRLPRKAFELIGGQTMLDRVIFACKKAAPRINNGLDLKCRIAVLTPIGDPIAKEFRRRIDIVEGPEHDVLSRYKIAMDIYKPDFMVRITGDCPLLPPYIISKLVAMAAINGYDYISNVDERFRTALDGADCEVISERLLDFVCKNADSTYDREHVTTFIRRNPPEWATIGCVVNYFDHSGLKFSVDTPEDLERVRAAFALANDKYQEAVRVFGHHHVHRI